MKGWIVDSCSMLSSGGLGVIPLLPLTELCCSPSLVADVSKVSDTDVDKPESTSLSSVGIGFLGDRCFLLDFFFDRDSAKEGEADKSG